MRADAKTASDLFIGTDRYVVPAYQRPYVWQQDLQWEPLWDDIARLADARVEDHPDAHFLGAIVIRQEKSSPGAISEWSVIDGQQRLTSLQLVFSAIAEAAESDGVEVEARRLRKLTMHGEDEAKGDDRFRFWPTTVNRAAFAAVMQGGGLPGDHEDDPENTIEEAWQFFRDRAREYAASDDASAVDNGLSPEERLQSRYGALRDAAAGMVQIVVIQLDKEDPAQVVFETLNARGTPLLAIDLVKNALLERAEQAGHDVEEVHDKYWAPEFGDYEYWSGEQTLGRYTTQRSEVFLMYWLAMKLGGAVSTEGLFDRFRRAFLEGPDAPDPLELLEEMSSDAALLRSFPELPVDSPAGSYLQAARMVDITLLSPLVLALMKTDLSADRMRTAFGMLESFIVRRMIARLRFDGLNKVVGELVRKVLADPERADEVLAEELLGAQNNQTRWPSDDELREKLQVEPLYGWLGRQRIIGLLSTIEVGMRSSSLGAEPTGDWPKKLQIEHIMPQSWRTNWPLPDPDDEEAIQRRESRIHLLGNLTLVDAALNAGKLSNNAWPEKRRGLNKHSIMMLNKEIENRDSWDEEAIDTRGAELTEVLLERWPGMEDFVPEGWKLPNAELVPENAEMGASEVREVFDDGTKLMRELLLDLAAHAGERRTYAEIEASIGWPPRKVGQVFGGYTNRFSKFNPRRPFHIHLDATGTWWMWMDTNAADVVNTAAAEVFGSPDDAESQARARIEAEEVRILIDTIPERFEATDGCVAELFKQQRDQVQLSGVDGRRARGYFAKNWLFLWWYGRFTDDEAWFKARLSSPDQVVEWGNGELRLHVLNEADLDVVIEALAGSSQSAAA